MPAVRAIPESAMLVAAALLTAAGQLGCLVAGAVPVLTSAPAVQSWSLPPGVWVWTDPATERLIASIVGNMTLHEKARQLVTCSADDHVSNGRCVLHAAHSSNRAIMPRPTLSLDLGLRAVLGGHPSYPSSGGVALGDEWRQRCVMWPMSRQPPLNSSCFDNRIATPPRPYPQGQRQLAQGLRWYRRGWPDPRPLLDPPEYRQPSSNRRQGQLSVRHRCHHWRGMHARLPKRWCVACSASFR